LAVELSAIWNANHLTKAHDLVITKHNELGLQVFLQKDGEDWDATEKLTVAAKNIADQYEFDRLMVRACSNRECNHVIYQRHMGDQIWEFAEELKRVDSDYKVLFTPADQKHIERWVRGTTEAEREHTHTALNRIAADYTVEVGRAAREGIKAVERGPGAMAALSVGMSQLIGEPGLNRVLVFALSILAEKKVKA
jgi:hypothetical protein